MHISKYSAKRRADQSNFKKGREMAHPKRFELLTPRFVVWCSIQLSYGCVCKWLNRLRGDPLKAGAEDCKRFYRSARHFIVTSKAIH